MTTERERTPEDFEALKALSTLRSRFERQAQETYGKGASKCTWPEIWALAPPCMGLHFPRLAEAERAALMEEHEKQKCRVWGTPFPEKLDHSAYFCLCECKWRHQCFDETETRRHNGEPQEKQG